MLLPQDTFTTDGIPFLFFSLSLYSFSTLSSNIHGAINQERKSVRKRHQKSEQKKHLNATATLHQWKDAIVRPASIYIYIYMYEKKDANHASIYTMHPLKSSVCINKRKTFGSTNVALSNSIESKVFHCIQTKDELHSLFLFNTVFGVVTLNEWTRFVVPYAFQ